MITPKMVRTLGTNTPENVPNPTGESGSFISTSNGIRREAFFSETSILQTRTQMSFEIEVLVLTAVTALRPSRERLLERLCRPDH